MKLGIAVTAIGAFLLAGNMIDFQTDPVWALVVRMLFSSAVLGAGLWRLVYKLRAERNRGD